MTSGAAPHADSELTSRSSDSPDRVTRIVRGVLPFVTLAFAGVLAVRRGVAPLENDDTFFHLRFGQEFLSGWSPWAPGSVSSVATRDWVPTQWLSQVVMASAEDLFGMAGVAWLSGLTLLVYVLALWTACRAHADPLVASLVTVVAFLASAQGLSARPQLVSYVLVVVMTSAWLHTREDGRLRWWLVPLAWFWAMAHGMWPVGVVIGLVSVVGLLLDGTFDRRRARQALLIPLGSLLVAGLTPVGPRLYVEVVEVASRGRYFEEWGPPDFRSLFPMVCALLFATTLLVLLRGEQRIPWTSCLLLLVAGGWAVYSVRTVPLAAAMLAPIAAAAFQTTVGIRTAPGNREKRCLLAGFGVGLAALAALAPALISFGPSHPAWVDDDLSTLPPETVVLNDWQWGGYLMWEHPELNFVLHGYGDVFTTAELDRNVALQSVKAGWQEDLEQVGAEVALLEAGSDLAYALEESLDWVVMRSEDEVVLLAAPGSDAELSR